MDDPLRQSAVYRCPTEMWVKILRLATARSPLDLHLHEFDAEEILDGVPVLYQTRISMERDKSLETAFNVSLVCRAWRDIAEPLIPLACHVRTRRELHETALALSGTLDNHVKGRFTRFLEIDSDVPKKRHPHRVQWLSVVAELNPLISTCSHLEEFSCYCHPWISLSHLLSFLIPACGSTLTYVCLHSYYQSFPRDVCALLKACPRLEALHFRPFHGAIPLLEPPDIDYEPVDVALPLRSIMGDIANLEQHVEFLKILASLNASCLHHMHLNFQPWATNIEIYPTDVLPVFKSVFISHGVKLRSLLVNGMYELEALLAGKTTEMLLDLCPNLEEFAFDFTSVTWESPRTPHRSLRRVHCRHFFADPLQSPGSSPELSAHLVHIQSFVETVCGPAFPNMELVRFTDVHPFPAAELKERRSPVRRDFPSEYRKLAQMISDICAAQKVRFEDCSGHLVGKSFAPPADLYWPAKYEGEKAGRSNALPAVTEGVQDEDPFVNDPEAQRVRRLRHHLQKLFCGGGGVAEDQMDQANQYLSAVEDYHGMTADYLLYSKIGKVMRKIAVNDAIPREEKFNFRERAQSLVEEWHDLLQEQWYEDN